MNPGKRHHFFFKRFESLSLGNIISSPKWRVIKDQMKKPGPELGKDISKVTSSRLCEQLDAACEEKDSEENDSCVSASFFYREWEESKGKMSSICSTRHLFKKCKWKCSGGSWLKWAKTGREFWMQKVRLCGWKPKLWEWIELNRAY